MLRRDRSPLLNAEALGQPLTYEHEMDAALLLKGSEEELTRTEHLAAAYYLQYRTTQLTRDVALTGNEVAEKVEQTIENIQDVDFLHLLTQDYRAATEPKITQARRPKETHPESLNREDLSLKKRSQLKVSSVLGYSVLYVPFSAIGGFGGGELIAHTLGTTDDLSSKIIGTLGGALLAGVSQARKARRLRQEPLDEKLAINSSQPSLTAK